MVRYLYTPQFCEENIWQLARSFVAEGIAVETLQVIFVSNPLRQVVLFGQRNGAELGHVVWDYHVILRRHDAHTDRIYDFDSQLPFPSATWDYFSATFGLQAELDPTLRACLRLVPATEFLRRFCSNRAHMEGVVTTSAFPEWPAIIPAGDDTIPLEKYWDMAATLADGSRVVSVDTFLANELAPWSPTQSVDDID